MGSAPAQASKDGTVGGRINVAEIDVDPTELSRSLGVGTGFDEAEGAIADRMKALYEDTLLEDRAGRITLGRLASALGKKPDVLKKRSLDMGITPRYILTDAGRRALSITEEQAETLVRSLAATGIDEEAE